MLGIINKAACHSLAWHNECTYRSALLVVLNGRSQSVTLAMRLQQKSKLPHDSNGDAREMPGPSPYLVGDLLQVEERPATARAADVLGLRIPHTGALQQAEAHVAQELEVLRGALDQDSVA